MSFLRGLASMIGFKVTPVKPSDKKDDEVGKKKSTKLKVGNYITNKQGNIIARIISISPTYAMSIEAKIIAARAISEIGTPRDFEPKQVKRISKKQAKKIKAAIEKTQETKYRYKDKSPVCIGDMIKFNKGYPGSSDGNGVIIDADESAVPLKVKVFNDVKSTLYQSSSYIAWVGVDEIIEKTGRYDIKAQMKKASKDAVPKKSYKSSRLSGYQPREKFRVGIANVYEENQFPHVDKAFLDGIRGPDPEPTEINVGGSEACGIPQTWYDDDYDYYDQWWSRQRRFPIV